jgi:hypothetical protein
MHEKPRFYCSAAWLMSALALLAVLSACQPGSPLFNHPSLTLPPTGTATHTPLPTLTHTRTATATQTLIPTSTPTATPSPTPTLPASLRYPPAVLILHSTDPGNAEFLRDFLPLLPGTPFTVTTLEKLAEDPDIPNPLVIMIDQFYWGRLLTPADAEAIQVIRESGYPAAIAILPVPIRRHDNNDMVGELVRLGWEVVNNTDVYEDLSGKHWFDVAAQVDTGGGRMANVGGREKLPITVLPPFGRFTDSLYEAIDEMWAYDGVSSQIVWVVVDVPYAPYDINERTHTIRYETTRQDAETTLHFLLERYSH